MQEITDLIYSSPDRKIRSRIEKWLHLGKIRHIGNRLYTSVSKAKEKEVVRANWAHIVDELYPGSLLSYRTALEYKLSPEGNIYLTAKSKREVIYPGLKLCFVKGPSPRKDDPPFFTKLKASSFERAILENFSTVRKENSDRVLSREEIEKKLESILTLKGEKALNDIRDKARRIAGDFAWEKEFRALDKLIGALLGSKEDKSIRFQIAKARFQGRPYDIKCLDRLEILFSVLKTYPFNPVKEIYKKVDHYKNKAFFESYFSNYIEGTTFEVEEAEEIVFDKRIPEARPKDAHDILGTYLIVSDPNEMKQTPKNYLELENLLIRRHQILMKNRPEISPGSFKLKPNRAGNTHFVLPDYVEGTLEKAFPFYLSLENGMQKAIFIMFLVNEVHPFTDGNGRMSRIMLNSELYSEGLSSIIIPNVYREDYLSALRAMSRRHRAEPLIKMLSKAQNFSHLDFTDYPKVLNYLKEHNWFEEPSDAKIIG